MAETEKSIAELTDEAYETVGDLTTKSIRSNVKEHNTVFRQMASNLILIAGIFLALSSNFGSKLVNESGAVKILSLLTIVTLNLSILFGVWQLFLEASFFRANALGRIRINKEHYKKDVGSLSKLSGAIGEFEQRQGRGTKRWPTIVQLCCLGTAMILVSVTVGLQMYA